MAPLFPRGRFGLILLSLVSSLLVPNLGVLGQAPTYEIETANFMTLPISSIHGFIPMPWACTFAPSPATQTLLQFHANWHCTYPDSHAEFGRRFFGFHKQFGLGYNFYLASLGFPFVQTFYPAPSAPVPPSHVTRPQNAPCTGCVSLPNNFRAPPLGTLHLYTTVQALGQAIVGWHNSQHGALAGGFSCGSQTTPARGDMNCFTTSPRDPVFWRYHSIFDEVQEAWHSLQDANVALVLDRSGSMSATIPAFGITRLQAAKDAAQMFADMVDVTSGHRLGLVTFSSGATTNLGLTGASTFSSALSSAMSSVGAGGSTSIGAGLNAGQTLVTGGTQPRKGIVLLTDGQENVAPMISSVNLGDTHLCAVGFGSPSNLDGAKLRNLAEKQGGVWTSTQDPVELKKVFVQCFSNIFDAAQAIDPIDTLPYSSPISPPTIHGAMGDDTVIFVLGWADPKVKLQLSITTPSGGVVNLGAPNVQSRIGPTWHVVRIKLPYQGERDGDWSGRAVLQPVQGFVNGFSSLAVTGAGTDAGVQLLRNQLATLCSSGCGRVLFYQHTTNDTSVLHGGGTSIYHEAVMAEINRGAIGNATITHQAADFSKLLSSRSGAWDLVVYNAPGPDGAQPYDEALASLLCAGGGTKYIVSDARPVGSADDILKCAGATRGESVTADSADKTYLTPGDSQFFPDQLQLGNPVVKDSRSYAVAGGSAQASYAGGGLKGAASVAIGGGGGSGSVQYFISVLARSSVKLKPYTYINNTYVGEDLHPSFYVPAPYWPSCGFTHISGNVTITRPLASLAALRADPKDDTAPGADIPTETATYSLSDAGGDHRFEAALAGLTKYDGAYKLHARVRLCNQQPCGRLSCIVREAEHVLDVLPKAAQAQTGIKVVRQLGEEAAAAKRSGEKRAKIVITPRDEDGVALGRGHLAQLVARGVCGAVVEKFEEIEEDGGEEASYAATVSYPESGGSDSSCKRAGVAIHMYGRPKEALIVDL